MLPDGAVASPARRPPEWAPKPAAPSPLLDTCETSLIDALTAPLEWEIPQEVARELDQVRQACDVVGTRRDGRWTWQRRAADRVAELLRGTGDPRLERHADRIAGCSLRWAVLVDLCEGRIIRRRALCCRDRWCPVCMARRAAAVRAEAWVAAVKIAALRPELRWLLLTLTLRNVVLEELRATVRRIGRGWQRLVQRRDWPGVAWMRSLEVTRGSDGSAHPHVHAIVAVEPDYFRSDAYLPTERWSELWGEAIGADYRPVVDVRVVRPGRDIWRSLRGRVLGREWRDILAVGAAIGEAAKYPLKLARSATDDPAWLREAVRQLDGVRQVSYGGMWAPAHRAARRDLERRRAERRREIDRWAATSPFARWLWFTWNGRDYVRARSEQEAAWTAEMLAVDAGVLEGPRGRRARGGGRAAGRARRAA